MPESLSEYVEILAEKAKHKDYQPNPWYLAIGLTTCLVVLVFMIALKYRAIDFNDPVSGIVFHVDVSDWPLSIENGVSEWSFDQVKYTDTDKDGNIDTRLQIIGNEWILAKDTNNDGAFDQLIRQPVTDDRDVFAKVRKIYKWVPKTKKTNSE